MARVKNLISLSSEPDAKLNVMWVWVYMWVGMYICIGGYVYSVHFVCVVDCDCADPAGVPGDDSVEFPVFVGGCGGGWFVFEGKLAVFVEGDH